MSNILNFLHQTFINRTFKDNHPESNHYGQTYVIRDIKLSLNRRYCFQVTYENGGSASRLLEDCCYDYEQEAQLAQTQPKCTSNKPKQSILATSFMLNTFRNAISKPGTFIG